jgi:hypothetical protein
MTTSPTTDQWPSGVRSTSSTPARRDAAPAAAAARAQFPNDHVARFGGQRVAMVEAPPCGTWLALRHHRWDAVGERKNRAWCVVGRDLGFPAGDRPVGGVTASGWSPVSASGFPAPGDLDGVTDLAGKYRSVSASGAVLAPVRLEHLVAQRLGEDLCEGPEDRGPRPRWSPARLTPRAGGGRCPPGSYRGTTRWSEFPPRYHGSRWSRP